MTKTQRIDTIVAGCLSQGITNKRQIQYVLATVEHETNNTFEAVKEAYWLSEKWRKDNLRYYPYYGRGLVQITWKENYEKFGCLLDVNLVNNPDLALDFNNAVFILCYGMANGSFTGKSLDDYTSDIGFDYIEARRIINGTDKASHIASLAGKYATLV